MMFNLLNNPSKRMLVFSFMSVILSFLMVVVVGFAWFSMSEYADTSLTNIVGDINAEFELYVYLDDTRQGNNNPTLSNICSAGTEQGCYYLVESNEQSLVPTIIFGGTDHKVYPGNRFSFAMKVTNIGNMDAFLELEFNNLVSEGYSGVFNKIQVAFRYYVTKIVHTYQGVETNNIIDQYDIIHYNALFSYDSNQIYSLARNVPLSGIAPETRTVIIFFELYFDPTVSGYTSLGQPTNNSNPFQNQFFSINQIKMILSKQ